MKKLLAVCAAPLALSLVFLGGFSPKNAKGLRCFG